ncbi:MAG: LuxR C-terminal-related transcriptional regulator [Verrucomicrobiota bacterium]
MHGGLSKERPPQRDYGLTPRETEILQLLVEGFTIKEASGKLGAGFYTADEYIRKVYEKLQVRNRGGAIEKAISENLIPPKR